MIIYNQLILRSNKITRNGRLYPPEVLKKAVHSLCSSYGQIGSPMMNLFNLVNASHTVVLRYVDDMLLADITVLETPAGLLLSGMIDDGVDIRFYSHGNGTIVDRIVQDNYRMNQVYAERSDFVKTTACPECGCSDYYNPDELGEGYRTCVECGQEWWTDIEYS